LIQKACTAGCGHSTFQGVSRLLSKFTVRAEVASEFLLPKYAEIIEEFVKRKQCQDEILKLISQKYSVKNLYEPAVNPSKITSMILKILNC
jgi:hypothetical protein